MGIKAVKFGGTSLCSAAQMKKAAEIVLADADRRVVVVSAPGKCSPEDDKITDLLYRCYEEPDEKIKAWLFNRIRHRFDGMISELSLPLDFLDEKSCCDALQIRAKKRGFIIPEKVAAFLVKHSNRDMDSLVKILDRLDEASLSEQHELTVPFVKKVLSI